MQNKNRNKILIIDENSTYIARLRKDLKNSGYEVIYFNETEKAVEIIEKIEPNLIISEVELSKANNHQFFKLIKADDYLKNIPFVFFSSQKRVDDRIKSIEMGVDDFISKPFFIDEVVARIENLLNEVAEQKNSESINEKGFSGDLSDMNLIDLIQTLKIGNKSGIIHLNQSSFSGNVFIANGKIIDAIFEDIHPDDAILKLFLWTEGKYSVEITTVNRQQTINEDDNELIAQGAKLIQKWEQLTDKLPSVETEITLNKSVYDKNSISTDEQSLLSSLNGENIIFDIIQKSSFDDLRAIEIINDLYQKGYIVETGNNSSNSKKKSKIHINENVGKLNGDNDNTTDVISKLLTKKNNKDEILSERRSEDRRKNNDRRQIDDRRSDNNIQKQKIYLNKTELLMIREKLL